MSATIEIKGLDEERKKLEQLLTTSPAMDKRLRGVIRKVLGDVRAKLRKDAPSGLQMQSDPRHAYKAVRFAVYKRIFGGNVNILDGRAKSTTSYNPPRKGVSGRGGNRGTRSQRTEQLESYEGAARGFVLRFLNAGTKPRYAGYGRNGRNEYEYNMFISHHGGMGFRGSIAPRNWFGPKSQAEMEAAADKIQGIIDRIINEEFV